MVRYTVSYSTLTSAVGNAGQDAGRDDEEQNMITSIQADGLSTHSIAWKSETVTTIFILTLCSTHSHFDRWWLSTSGAFRATQIHRCDGAYYDVYLACMLYSSTVSLNLLIRHGTNNRSGQCGLYGNCYEGKGQNTGRDAISHSQRCFWNWP